MRKEFPILEFDDSVRAKIEPSREIEEIGAPEACVICFFSEVVEKVVKEHQAELILDRKWEDGPRRIYSLLFEHHKVAVLHSSVGAPAAVGQLEQAIASGCRKFIVCGGAGVLDSTIQVGHVIVPTSAVRDEGTSYHYIEPSREIKPDQRALRALEAVLWNHGVEYLRGKTWTTDAPYRETEGKVQMRRAEGCVSVEMEASALFAVAHFRRVPLAQLLYAGDDVGSEEWDRRDWQERSDIREELFWFAVESAVMIGDET